MHRGMLQDEEVYPDPTTFSPQRFEPVVGTVPPPDPRALVYGFGRRWCSITLFGDKLITHERAQALSWRIFRRSLSLFTSVSSPGLV